MRRLKRERRHFRRKRKGRRGRIILILSAFFLLLYSGNKAYLWVHRTPLFKLKEVKIQGNLLLSKDSLLEEAGITPGLNLFKIRGESVEERLLQNPRIKWVEVKRRFPGTLHLKVKEKESIGRFNGSYVLTDDGEIIEGEAGRELPSVIGKDRESAKEGAKLLKALGDLPYERVDATDPDEIHLFITPRREVRLGRGDYEMKISRLIRILKEFSERSEEIDVIDLRFKDQAILINR